MILILLLQKRYEIENTLSLVGADRGESTSAVTSCASCLPLVMLAGMGLPCIALSLGLWSNVSRCDAPPAIVSQITRVAFEEWLNDKRITATRAVRLPPKSFVDSLYLKASKEISAIRLIAMWKHPCVPALQYDVATRNTLKTGPGRGVRGTRPSDVDDDTCEMGIYELFDRVSLFERK